MSNRVKLPVDGFEKQIVETVKENPVTIIVAETGAGKSTRIPFMVMMALGHPVIVTEPRRIAAESLATRVTEETGLVLGGLVGYQTAVDGKLTSGTMLLYCTDGLALVRELTEAKRSLKNGFVLIIDEVHEFNENIETLLAWSDELINQGVDVKIIIMSATIEHESLSEYFNGAPVIHVPGRAFPVKGAPSHETSPRQVGEEDLLKEVQSNIWNRRNTLVFLPGKTEISKTREEVELLGLNAEIMELHGDLSPEEQMMVFESYDRPKLILATNIAQTSVTIPDIDSVIDSGYEKRIELWNGVETLAKRCISKADVRQRAGRAGRTKEGVYVLCNGTSYEKFSDYPSAEICQKRTDQMVLRLAIAGFDATALRFFHQPDAIALKDSKKILIDMGALQVDGTVTDLGRQINRFPTSIIVARMIIEAIKRKCLTRILTFAAILSTSKSSIKLSFNKYRKDPPDYNLWDTVIPEDKEYTSDLFVEYDLWDLGYKSSYGQFGQNGIDKKSYMDAVDIRKELKTIVFRIGYHAGSEYNEHAENDTEVLKCVTAGLIHTVYRYGGENKYLANDRRFLSKDSLVNRTRPSQLVVGIPVNIPINKAQGDTMGVLPILSNCTRIELAWLNEIAPNLGRVVEYPVSWNYEKLILTSETVTYFNKQEVARVSTPAEWSEENLTILADAMSHVFLPEGDPRTEWIEALREEFVKRGCGDNFAFAREFFKHTLQYGTLDIGALGSHKQIIRGRVLMNSKIKMQQIDLPEVKNGDYVSAIMLFVGKAQGTAEFVLAQRSNARTVHSATCKVTLHDARYEAVGSWLSTSKLAKHDAAKVMYEKLLKESKFYVPVISKPKPSVPSKKEWSLPEVKNGDYVSALFLFATKQRGKIAFTPVQNGADTYKSSSICQLKVGGEKYELSGEVASNKASAKQNAAKGMYEKIAGIIAESLVLA